MTLKERLLEDMKVAMKNKDSFRKNIISMVRAAILQVEKDTLKELDDDGVIGVITKEIKQRKEIIPEYEKGGRQDLIEKANKEIEILMEYLPKQLTEDEIRELVKQTINETGASGLKDMGKVMSVLMPKVKGKADGQVVNRIVKEYLQA